MGLFRIVGASRRAGTVPVREISGLGCNWVCFAFWSWAGGKLGSFRIFGPADGGRGANCVRFAHLGVWGGCRDSRLRSFRIFGSWVWCGVVNWVRFAHFGVCVGGETVDWVRFAFFGGWLFAFGSWAGGIGFVSHNWVGGNWVRFAFLVRSWWFPGGGVRGFPLPRE